MTWLWNATRERPRSSRPIVASRNGWLFSMSPFSVKAHWIVSVIGLISSSLMASRIGNEPHLRGSPKPKCGEPGFPQRKRRHLRTLKWTQMSAESEETRTKHLGLWGGRLWKLPQLWKKAKRYAAFSHSCLDKPSDKTGSAYPQLPQGAYDLSQQQDGNNNPENTKQGGRLAIRD